jgi:FHS family glucose/mannose:H+ symporter-like MFS transporter
VPKAATKAGAIRALLLSGFLLALPGALLPLWGYHVRPDFGTAGNYFLALGAGLALAMALARFLSRRARPGYILAAGFFVSAAALLLLTVSAPPATVWYQALCIFTLGAAAGLINGAIFELIGVAWEADPAGVTLRGGIYFGAGSAAASLLMSNSFGGEATAARIFFVCAVLSAVAGIAIAKSARAQTEVEAKPEPATPQTEPRTVLALIFGFLLFFQFANEWSIAGWLPVFLIDRLGISPAGAIAWLAVYWMALTIGRIAASILVNLVPHGRLLGISAFCALFGGVSLTASDTRGGMIVGILLIGAGFSAIVPLASERVAPRFTGYHPGYFSGLFMFAMSGAVFADFLLGHLADLIGLRAIPAATIVGSLAVIALIMVIRLGRKVSGN